MIEKALSLLPVGLFTLGAGGLAVLGLALIAYSMLPLSRFASIARPTGVVTLIAAALLGVKAWGESRYLDGVEIERTKWEHEVALVRASNDAARVAVQQFGTQIADDVEARIASLPETISKEILDAARAEDDKPVPENCRDVYRGLPPGVLQRLDQIR